MCAEELVDLLAAFWNWRFRFISALVQLAWPVCIESWTKTEQVICRIVVNRANGVVVSGQEPSFIFWQPHRRASLEQANDSGNGAAAKNL